MAGSMDSPYDSRQVRRAFGRAASAYSATAVLQREVEARLLEQLDYAKAAPQRIVDLGAGPGRASVALKKRWPQAQVIAIDLALPMLREARKQAGWWRPKFARVNANAAVLPLPPSMPRPTANTPPAIFLPVWPSPESRVRRSSCMPTRTLTEPSAKVSSCLTWLDL